MKSKISVVFITMLLLLSYGCGKMDEEKAAEIILNSVSPANPIMYMGYTSGVELTKFNSVEILELHERDFYVGQLDGIIDTVYDLELIENAKISSDKAMAFARCRVTADLKAILPSSKIKEDALLDEPTVLWIWLLETDKGWEVDVLGLEKI
jgi:hypothetical protein